MAKRTRADEEGAPSARRVSLRTQLFAFTLAVSAPLLLVLAHSTQRTAADAVERARETSAALAQTAARSIGEELARARRLGGRLAERPLVRALDPARCDPLVGELVRLDRAYMNAATFLADGTVVCSVLPAGPGAHVPVIGAADGRPSNVLWGPISRVHNAVVQTALESPSGVSGRLGLVLNLEALGGTLAGVPRPPGAQVYVVDGAGLVVAAVGSGATAGARARDAGLPDVAGPGAYLVDAAPVPGTPWRAVAALPSADALAPARDAARRSAALAAVALVAMLATSALLGRRVARPIAALADTAHAVRLGDDEARAPLAGPREVAAVAAELNAALDARRDMEAIRSAAETSLRVREQRHRELAELASELALSWRVLPDGTFERDWSTERLDRFLALDPAQPFDPQLRSRLHPDDAPVLAAARAKLVAKPCTVSYELRWRRASDGAWRWVRHTARSVHEPGPNGSAVRVLHSGEDVTDARSAAQARDERLAWEELVSDVSRRFLAAQPHRLDVELAPALDLVRVFLGVDRVALNEVGGTGLRALAWARGPGVADPLVEASVADFPVSAAQLRAGAPFVFGSLAELDERAPPDAAGFRRIGAEAALLQPLYAAGQPIGALVLASVAPRAWSEDDLRRTATLGELFANAVARMQTDRALRQSEARYRSLVENAGDAILVADAETGVILEANHRAAELTGRGVDALVGMPHTALYDAGEAAARAASFAQRAGGTPGTSTAQFLRPDGRRVPVEVSTALVTAGGRRALLGIFRDLSERHRAEEETRRLKEFYAGILDSVRDGILVTDSDDRVRYANRSYARALGVPRERLLGVHVAQDAPADAARELREQFARAKETLQPTPYEGTVPRADGRVLQQAGWFVPLVEEGAYNGMLCTAEDVTERRAVEETLRHTQEQFLQAQKMEAVGRLAGGVAHDFNNILSVILSYAELLQDDLPARDPRRPDLEEIVRASRAGANLTRQLLAFSRKQVTEPRVVRLGELVAGAQKLLKRLIGEDIALDVSGVEAPWRVRVDPGHLEQVMLNLAVNARDAMPAGGRLAIAVGAVAPETPLDDAGEVIAPGRWVTLAMTDTGCGMDAATRAHAFEPFFSTKGPGKGTGLGLATVYGIVQQAGGHVVVESAPRRGTAFRVYLPQAEDDAFEDAPAERVAAPWPEPARDETVLVVEDDPALRQVMERVLSAAGYRVLAAASGDDALRTAAGHRARIQLLLTDVVMPGMNGRELATRLCADRPDVRTLFLSGYTDEILGPHGVLDPGMHLLHKPFTQPQLLEAVRKRLAAA